MDDSEDEASKKKANRPLATNIKGHIIKRGTKPEVEPSVKFNRFGFGNMNDDINTPSELFAILHDRFHFAFDPFPSKVNRPATFDGFAAEWRSPAYCNPPYSCIPAALEKALAEMRSERRVCSVFLIPMRGNNVYWSQMVWPYACAIWFFQGRMRFEGYEKPSPMPMALVVFDPDKPATTAEGVHLSNHKRESAGYIWHELSVV